MQLMRPVFAIALAAVVTLPYVTPVVCAALDPEMTVASAGMSGAVEGDEMADNCETLDCATVPVAPTATASNVFTVRPPDGRDLPAAPLPPQDSVLPPITHPPRA